MSEDEYLRQIDWEDCPYRGNSHYGWAGRGLGRNDETRFLRIQCPDCGRLFAGWYRRDDGAWTLFDSSFFFAFNDEPSQKDLAEAHEPPRQVADERIEELASESDPTGRMSTREAASVLCELLAARRVVDAARALLKGHQNCGTTDCCLISQEIDSAIAAYDEVTK